MNYRKVEFWTNATFHTFCFTEGIDDQENDRKTKGHFYPVTKEPTTPSQDVPRKRKTRHSQNPIQEMHVGWILDSRSRGGESGGGRTRNSDSVCSETGSVASSYGTPQSLPTFHHPSHALLKENQFTQLQYSKYHSRCLKGKFQYFWSEIRNLHRIVNFRAQTTRSGPLTRNEHIVPVLVIFPTRKLQ